MKKTINWGIVGLGKIANKFAQDIRLVKGARLHAVASRTLGKAQAFGEQYQATHVFGSYEELVSCPDLDVVYIATPHVFHCENSLLFLKSKIPVLCEKPLAMNAKEVKTMINCAKENDTYLMQAIWTRFFPLMEKSMELIEKGEIGAIKSINADFGFHANWNPDDRLLDKKLGGGAILDVGIYPIFITYLLLGKPNSIIVETTLNELGVDETSSIIFKYEDGVMANLFCSLNAHTEVEATIYGKKGKLKLHGRFHHPKTISYGDYYSGITTLNDNYKGNGYQYEIEAVGQDLLNHKKENKLLTHQFSLELTEILDEVLKIAGIEYQQDQI